ncbi:MAG: hypothetical protein ACOH1I_07285 [Gallionellaceae bacterium]|jgi:uncharacterized DUF497 family protein
MRYLYDPQKKAANLKKHGLDFDDAREVIEGQSVTFEDRRFDYDRGALHHTVFIAWLKW